MRALCLELIRTTLHAGRSNTALDLLQELQSLASKCTLPADVTPCGHLTCRPATPSEADLLCALQLQLCNSSIGLCKPEQWNMLCVVPWRAFPHCGKAWCCKHAHVITLRLQPYCDSTNCTDRLKSYDLTCDGACNPLHASDMMPMSYAVLYPVLQPHSAHEILGVHCLQDSTMPGTLASICNNITFASTSGNGNQFCQGFVYDVQKHVAVFVAGPNSARQLLGPNDLCRHPTSYTWLRTQGQLQDVSASTAWVKLPVVQ